tara:strand:+ start:130 stop:447 length:318 start_codon:yes stop_codon:yes gene_type:complete
VPLEPYKDKAWMYEHYVKRRMNLAEIAKRLDQSHGISVSPQALYNWVKRFDLLKYRGKGRNLSGSGKKRPKSKMQLEVERQRRNKMKEVRMRKKDMNRRMGRGKR